MLDTQAAANQVRLQEALVKAMTASNPDVLRKATFNQPGTATAGLQGYDLEGPAKLLYPILTPLRNSIPRVPANGGSQANWKAVIGVATGNHTIGVSEGNRGAFINVQTRDYSASYKSLGHEADATFEAVNAGEGYEDIKARAATSGLHGFMIKEEGVILSGNSTVDLGVTPTPVVAGPTTGGSIPAATYSVICVALSAEGRGNATLSGGVIGRYNRTNADGSVDTIDGGSAQKSVAASVVTTGATSRITASVVAVIGAFGYAWFVGAAGAETLAAITGYSGLDLLALPPGGRQTATSLTAVDASTNNLVYDGLLTQAIKPGNGGYRLDRNGTPLTPDGAGGIVEFDAILRRYWDKLRMSPDEILISASEAIALTQAMLGAGVSTGAFRVVINPEQGGMLGGIIVATYLNKFAVGGSSQVAIRIHPNMPQGTILFWSKSPPYPLSGVNNMVQIKNRQDYYQIEWPLRTRRYEYGIYADSVLQHYFPPSLMVLTGVGKYQETDELA